MQATLVTTYPATPTDVAKYLTESGWTYQYDNRWFKVGTEQMEWSAALSYEMFRRFTLGAHNE